MTWVFDEAPTTKPADQLVLLAIADRCDDDGHEAYPSIATLVKKTRLSRRTVIRSIDRLRREGLLEAGGKRQSGTIVYSVRMTKCQSGTSVRVTPVSPRHVPSARVALSRCQADTPAGVSVTPDPSGTSDPSGTPEDGAVLFSVKVSRPEDLQALWNETTTHPIPRCSKLTSSRRRKSDARLREYGLDGMRAVFAGISASPFLCGKNDRGWKAHFDWALEPGNIAKVLEGNYASNRTGGRATGRTGEPAPGKYAGVEERDDHFTESAS